MGSLRGSGRIDIPQHTVNLINHLKQIVISTLDFFFLKKTTELAEVIALG